VVAEAGLIRVGEASEGSGSSQSGNRMEIARPSTWVRGTPCDTFPGAYEDNELFG